MRGPRVWVGGVSPPPGVADDSARAPTSLAGADSKVVPSPFADVEAGGRFRTDRLRGRTVSPSTRWQNTAMAVLLIGRQCCVSRSAMERYDARFCRNSVMTSFAGSKSWNFCGRRGVNSSTAFRTVAGSNEVIGWNDSDVKLETDRQEDGRDDAAGGTVHCQARFTIKAGQRRDCGRGQFEARDCLRTVCVRWQFPFADGERSSEVAAADFLLPRRWARTERVHGLFADTDGLSPLPECGLCAFVE